MVTGSWRDKLGQLGCAELFLGGWVGLPVYPP